MKNLESKILDLLKKGKKIQKEIYQELNATKKDQKKKIRKSLKNLLEEGKVFKDSRNRYNLPDKDTVIGIIEFIKSGNMGFVKKESGEEIAIPVEKSNNALHGDKVLVQKKGKWRDLEAGEVVKILDRNLEKVVGRFEKKKMFGFVVPVDGKINTDFYIAPEDMNKAKDGQIVEIEIKNYGKTTKNPEAKIINVIGDAEDPSVDLPIVISKHDLPQPKEFPESVEKEVEKIPKTIASSEKKGRKSFINQNIFTIDGETAKDFDDAVGIKILKNGNFQLSVHIADVSHYVKENSELDKEALNRATSVYLINTVIPMLPHELSDWMCSLVEGEERLTMSLEIEINQNGDVVDSEINNGLIKSVKRLTYNKVNELLSENPSEEIKDEIGFLQKDLENMIELMKILRNNRKERGSLVDIESTEVYFEFDEKGNVKDIKPVKRGQSERMIEEFMIKANETVAEYFDAQDLPFIYRVHEDPDPDMVIQLKNYLEMLGMKSKMPQNMHPKALQQVLENTKDHPLADSIQKVLIKSMKRAMYSEENIGHFGLASMSYTHFTSPIRRYPDLIVHRLLKKYIKSKGTLKKSDIEKYQNLLPEIADKCSKQERVADKAEWDLRDMKKVEYIAHHIGEVYEVYVTGVTKFGLFVEIPEKMINGLIHISELNDYFEYDSDKNRLMGQKTGKIYRIGDKINAVVMKANKIGMEVDFAPAENQKEIEKRLKKEHPNAKIKVKRRKKNKR
ncbi:MAG: ribonuclease R [Thermotogota bacterium]